MIPPISRRGKSERGTVVVTVISVGMWCYEVLVPLPEERGRGKTSEVASKEKCKAKSKDFVNDRCPYLNGVTHVSLILSGDPLRKPFVNR